MKIFKNLMVDIPYVGLAILLAIFTQSLVDLSNPIAYFDTFCAMLFLCALSIVVKGIIPSSLPVFCYATIVGIIVCLPDTILRHFLLDSIAKVSFLSCCVPLLTFAGLSAGGQIDELKKMSYKIVLIFFVVSTSCFFGASLVAQIGFKLTGAI